MVLNITVVNLVITLFACHPSCSPQFPRTLWQLSNGGHDNKEVTKKPNLLDTTLARDTCDKPTRAIARLFLSEPFCFLTSPIPNSYFSVEDLVFSTANCNRVSFPYVRLRKTQAKNQNTSKKITSKHLQVPICFCFIHYILKYH